MKINIKSLPNFSVSTLNKNQLITKTNKLQKGLKDYGNKAAQENTGIKEIKQQYKPWISKEILNSIRMREKLNNKFVKAKDKDVKEDYHKKYKQIRN